MKQVAAGYEGGDFGDNEGAGQFIQIDEGDINQNPIIRVLYLV